MKMRNETAKGTLIVIILGGAIFGAIFGLGGLEALDVNNYGLKQNFITKEVSPTARRGGGVHFVGIEYDYVRFPATWQQVDFTNDRVTSQTNDGIELQLEISFQYQLDPSKLYDMYITFGATWRSQITIEARGDIRDTMALYTVDEFLQNRSLVSNALKTNLEAKMNATMNIIVESFQLRKIVFPGWYLTLREDVAESQLLAQIAQYEQDAALIAAQTDLINAAAAANVSLIEAYAASNVTSIEAQAQANALNITMSMESFTMSDFMTQTGMNATEAIAYFYVQALENLPEGTTLVLGEFLSILIGT